MQQQETVSIEQLFREELAGIDEMLEAVCYLLEAEFDPTDPEYAELHNERIMLEQTKVYFQARLLDEIPHPLIRSQ